MGPNNAMEELTRKLDATHAEIATIQSQVIETLRAFYSNASAISIEEAMQIACKWTNTTNSSTRNQDDTTGQPQGEFFTQLDELNDALKELVQQMQPSSNASSMTTTSGASSNRSGASMGSISCQLVQSLTQQQRISKQLAQSNSMLQCVDKLVQIDALLRQSDMEMQENDGCVQPLADSIVKAEQLLQEMVGGDQIETNAKQDSTLPLNLTQMMRHQVLKRRNQLVFRLNQFKDTFVCIEESSVRVCRPQLDQLLHSRDPAASVESASNQLISDFWQTSQLLGLLPQFAKELAKNLMTMVFRPLLKPQTECLQVKVSQTGDFLVALKLESAPPTPQQPKPLSVASDSSEAHKRCDQVVQILEFVHQHILLQNDQLMAQLVQLLWKPPAGVDTLLQNVLYENIPRDSNALSVYKDTLLAALTGFEQKLGQLSIDKSCCHRLREYANHINRLYAKKRRQNIISQARKLLRHDYQDSVQVTGATERCNLQATSGATKKKGGKGSTNATSAGVGEDLFDGDIESGCFQLPDLRVSICAHQVVELAHQTLMEACTSDASSATLLFQTSRDVLFLFRVVISTLHEESIANDPRTCMLYHNDCIYLAYHMLTMGYLYKSRLPSPLNQTASMIDLVPGYREAGEAALVNYAQGQTNEILASFETLPAINSIEMEQEASQMEECFKTCLYKLNRISAYWRDSLPSAVYRLILGKMLSPILSLVEKKIFEESTIPSDIAMQLHHFVLLLLESEELFDSPAQAEKHVPSLQRLRRLAELLMESPGSIKELYERGHLSCFTSSELDRLIRALHRDSKERKDLLAMLS